MYLIRPSVFALCAAALFAQEASPLPKAPASFRDCIIGVGESDVYAWSIRDQAYVPFKYDPFGGNERVFVAPRGATILQPGHPTRYQLAAISNYADQEKGVYQWSPRPGMAPAPSQFLWVRSVANGPALEVEYRMWLSPGLTLVRTPHRLQDPLPFSHWVTQDFWIQIGEGYQDGGIDVFACGYLNGKMVSYGRSHIPIDATNGDPKHDAENDYMKQQYHAYTDDEVKQRDDRQTNGWKLAPNEYLVDPTKTPSDEEAIKAELVRRVTEAKP